MEIIGTGLFFWFFMCVFVGILASRRGRSGFGWFLISLIISPLLGGIFVLVLADKRSQLGSDAPTPETHVRCPDCRELVRKDASKCKHCGCKLIPQ